MAFIRAHFFKETALPKIKIFGLFVLVTLVSISCFATSVTAQSSTKTALVLNPKGPAQDIAPYAYWVEDEKKEFEPETLLERHKNNLRGERVKTDIINLGMEASSSWIVFSVENPSDNENWILHFGNALDGRIGLANKIMVMNDTTKDRVEYPNAENEDAENPLTGAAMSIKIKPRAVNTFIVHLQTQKGLPLILAPKIYSEKTFLKTLLIGDVSHAMAGVFFVIVLSFFLSSYYIGRNKASLALLSYYALLCALFYNLDTFFVGGFLGGQLIFILYIFSFIPILIATKFFIRMSYSRRPMENMALLALAVFIVASCLLHTSILGLSISSLITLVTILCLSMLSVIIIAMFISPKNRLITALFCNGLFFVTLSFLVLALSGLKVIPSSKFMVSFFWYLHLPEAACFMGAYLLSNYYRKKRKSEESKHQKHDEQSLVRMQKSKEAADQARLLRVIERERELMADLREREIRRTEEMRQAKELADKANQAKSAFLAVVSHEIRTPMNGILGMVQLLKDTEMSKSQNDYVDTIQKSGETMMSLLNDILDFEKIERGSMELESVNFNLQQLVKDVEILMSGHAAQQHIQLRSDIHPDVPVHVVGDPTRLRQVLLNLVNNGIKFTKDGSVTISIRPSKDQHEGSIHFAIVDTGIGISEDAQNRLFTPFAQAETSTSRKFGGTGLGLAISNRLIEKMGSKISVKSEEGQGSTFYFDITLNGQAESTNQGGQAESAKDLKTKPMKILVVEDNEMNRKVLEGLLSREGHTLFMASDGEMGLSMADEHRPDIIFMDIQMAGLNGIETTQKLRQDIDRKLAGTPIIALTGNVMLEDIERFFEAGMNGFISKPVNVKNLLEVLYNASIGKFENDLPSDFFDPIINETSETAPAPAQAPAAGSEEPTQERAPLAPEEEQPKPENTEADQSGNKRGNVTLGADLDLGDISHGLEFDERTVFDDETETKDAKPTAPAEAPKPTQEEKPNTSNANPADTENEPFVFNARKDANTEHLLDIPTDLLKARNKKRATLHDEKPKDTPHTHTSSAQQDSKNDDDMTEIQKYLLQQQSEDNKAPSATDTTPPAQTDSSTQDTATPIEKNEDSKTSSSEEKENKSTKMSDTATIIDSAMLKSMIDMLGWDQFFGLMDGFIKKADEIVSDMEGLMNVESASALGARAHELKGMAGNFGMKHVSDVAAEVEKCAKLGQNEKAIEHAKKLKAANVETKAALKAWEENEKSGS